MARYICSDLHLGHTNIIKYCNRPFADSREMDNCLISNWNSVVKPEDEVFFLGDFCFGRPGHEVSRRYRLQLNGKIHLILGNHDKYIDKSAFDSCQDWILLEENGLRILMVHYPIHMESYFMTKRQLKIPEYDICFYGHVHNGNENHIYPNHYNMSVEMTGYRPINFDSVIEVWKRKQNAEV